jgi:UV DNA damage endonuclease
MISQISQRGTIRKQSINRLPPYTQEIQKENKTISIKEYKILSRDREIQLGLCCLNITLRNQKPSVYASRKMIQRTILSNGIDALKSKIIENLQDVITMMKWNDAHGIRVFRLSSELFPHKTNPNIPSYNYEFALPLLNEIGKWAKYLGQRLTFHPGQYNVLGTPNEEVFQNTLNDLNYHAEVMDLMGLDHHSVIVVHAGGFFGDREKTIQRWCRNYKRLPSRVQRRLVLENCEKSFSIQHCLQVSREVNIPIVFDSHHFNCYKLLHPDEPVEPPEYYIPQILNTWKSRNIKPKFHISQQGEGKCGHHSDFINEIPHYLLCIPKVYGISIDIMVEAKKKELAIQQLYQLYPQLNCLK